MGILLTWKQRINVFIGKISLKFVPKNKSDSIVLKSKNWKKIYNEVNSYNYIKYTDVNDILLFGGSIDLNDIDKKVKEWTGDKELSSANIIANASKKYNNEEDIKFTFTDVENGIKSAKTNINKIYNENLSIKRYIDDEIKTLNLLKENSKKDIADGYKPTIKLLKSINHNNFILLQAKLNSYNEYIKLLGKAARSFKAKSDKNTEVSKDSYVDVDELPPEDKTFSTSYDDEI